MINRVWIAIGSNLLQPLKQVNSAIVQLANLPKTKLIACSSYYRSYPLGPQNQPDFLNAVVALDTTLIPEVLLNYIQFIEICHGRKRKKNHRFGPRTLDLDILLFGNFIINTPRLTIPHYDMHNRDFMLYPLIELAPNLQLPNGISLLKQLSQISCNNIQYWDAKHRYRKIK